MDERDALIFRLKSHTTKGALGIPLGFFSGICTALDAISPAL